MAKPQIKTSVKSSQKQPYKSEIRVEKTIRKPNATIYQTDIYKNVGARGTTPPLKMQMSSYHPDKIFKTGGGFLEPSYPRPPKLIRKPELSSNNIRVKKYSKGFHGIVKKPTYMLVGESGPEDVDVTPLKKFTPKTKNLPRFNSGKSKYPSLNLQKDSYTPKRSKVNIVKKLPKTNLTYPKMTDIFDVPQSMKSNKMKMPKNNYSMNMPKGDNMFGMMGKSANMGKSSKSIFPKMGNIFDMPKADSKGFNMGVTKNIFGFDENSFDAPSKKAGKFYNKVKGKKLDNLGGFGDWGQLDDKASKYNFGF